MEQYMVMAQELVTNFGVKFVTALAIFIIGRWVARMFSKGVTRLMDKNNVDTTLVRFVSNLIYFALLTVVILAALGQLGIQTTSFVAIIGAAGLAIGLALQGSLSNFASGVLLILFRPFKVDDLVDAGGALGVIQEISIFTTTLLTVDNKTVIVPNSKMTADNITNYTTAGKIRVDLVFGVGYSDDIDKTKSVIMDELTKHPKTMQDPAPFVGLVELADSSVNFAARPYCDPAHYWDVYFDLMESVKKRLDAEGLNIPFPQRDVHVYQHKVD